MSDFVAAVNALRSKLDAGFTTLPRYWPNDEREPTLEAAPNGFVLSEVRLQDEKPITIGPDGSRLHRDFGEFVVNVFVPAGSRAGTAETHAQSIRTLFGVNAVSGVRITRRFIGAGSNINGPLGRFWAVPVVIEWFSDRTE